MKICLFADIHGNGPAFSAALPMLLSEKADLNIFLGDLCGYFFDQQEVMEKMASLPDLAAIRGNHDTMALTIRAGDEVLRKEYLKKYGDSLERLLGEKGNAVLSWLAGCRDSFVDPAHRFVCFHGSPWDSLEGYVYPDTLLDNFLEEKADIFFLGHTHYPMVRTIGSKLIINPGSLGQPRQGGWPTYAVVELPSRTVHMREVRYDKEGYLNRLRSEEGVHPYLIDVLQR